MKAKHNRYERDCRLRGHPSCGEREAEGRGEDTNKSCIKDKMEEMTVREEAHWFSVGLGRFML